MVLLKVGRIQQVGRIQTENLGNSRVSPNLREFPAGCQGFHNKFPVNFPRRINVLIGFRGYLWPFYLIFWAGMKPQWENITIFHRRLILGAVSAVLSQINANVFRKPYANEPFYVYQSGSWFPSYWPLKQDLTFELTIKVTSWPIGDHFNGSL